MPRILSAPKHPEFLGRIIAAVRLGSEEREPKNAAERELLSELRAKSLKPEVAKRMTKALDGMPADKRQQLLGPMAERSFVLPEISTTGNEGVIAGGRRFRVDTAGTIFRRQPSNAEGTTANSGDVTASAGALHTGEVATNTGTVLSSEVGGGIRYTVRYQGLFCQEETDSGIPLFSNSFSDEIYVLTTALTVNKELNATSATIRHPKGYPNKTYADVDRGEERLGPVVAVWSGNPDVLSLAVVVIEHDQGDPDAYRDEIDYLVNAAIAAAGKYYPPVLLLELFEESIGDAINWLLGTGDDLLTTETKVLTREEIEQLALRSPGFYYGTRSTGLMYHFVTKHKADGAEYIVGFDIDRDPPRPPPPPEP